MLKPTIKIAVVSDVVCPWCYIGKTRLEKAVHDLSGEFQFEIAYYPFELNPDLPASGVDQKEYLTDKFGGDDQYERLTGHVTQVALNDGLVFNYDKQKISPNTRNAHRLILKSKEFGKELALVEALFKAYFTDGIDLSKNEALADVAASVGLDRDMALQFLNGDAGTAEIIVAEKELQKMGVRAVPFYIINDKYGVSGAQPAETFKKAFHNVSKEMQTAAGEACDVDEKNC